MRKGFLFAGMFLVVVLLFAQPSKADSFVDYTFTGHGMTATFSLPQTFTPAAPGMPVSVFNVHGTLAVAHVFSVPNYLYGTIDLGLAGYLGMTDYWDFGSNGSAGHPGPEFSLYAPNLFTVTNGSVTLNTGTWALGDYHLFQGSSIRDYTLTAVDPVSTPEPASLALLGVGSLALAGLRRRKSA